MRARALTHWLADNEEQDRLVCVGPAPASRGQVLSAIAGLAESLPPAPVLISCQAPLAMAIALLACWRAGAKPVLPVNRQPGSLLALRAEVAALISDETAPAEFTDVRCPALKHGDTEGITPVTLPLSATLTLWTSGSSGQPKRVVKTLAQLDAELCALETQFGAALTGTTTLASVPTSHIYGLLFWVLWPLCAGRPLFNRSSLHPDELQLHARRHAPAVLISSPAQLKRLPDAMTLPDLRGTLRAVFCSGGPLPPESAAAWRSALGEAPLEILGATETGGIAWRQQQGADLSWRCLPGVGADTDATGALRVRSPFLADEQPFCLGDAARFTADGRFSLQGRLDRIVKVEEKRLSLSEMEARLGALAEIEAAAVTVLHGRRTEVAAVVVLANPSATDSKAARNARLRAALAPYFDGVLLPRRWRYVDALPYDERGKLPVAALNALFEEPSAVTNVLQLPEIIAQRQDGDSAEFHLRVPAATPYFEGHYPEHPILPGVIQIGWAEQLARRFFTLPERFIALEALKFQDLILPNAELELRLVYKPERGKLEFSFLSARGKHSSGRLVYRDEARN